MGGGEAASAVPAADAAHAGGHGGGYDPYTDICLTNYTQISYEHRVDNPGVRGF